MNKLYPAQSLIVNFLLGLTITHAGAYTISSLHQLNDGEMVIKYVISALLLFAAVLFLLKKKIAQDEFE